MVKEVSALITYYFIEKATSEYYTNTHSSDISVGCDVI